MRWLVARAQLPQMFTSRDSREKNMAEEQPPGLTAASKNKGSVPEPLESSESSKEKEVDIFRDTYVRYLGSYRLWMFWEMLCEEGP